jgi:hypothetical protein
MLVSTSLLHNPFQNFSGFRGKERARVTALGIGMRFADRVWLEWNSMIITRIYPEHRFVVRLNARGPNAQPYQHRGGGQSDGEVFDTVGCVRGLFV